MLLDAPGLKLAVVFSDGRALPLSLSDAKKWDYDGSSAEAGQQESLGPQYYHKLIKLQDEPTP